MREARRWRVAKVGDVWAAWPIGGAWSETAYYSASDPASWRAAYAYADKMARIERMNRRLWKAVLVEDGPHDGEIVAVPWEAREVRFPLIGGGTRTLAIQRRPDGAPFVRWSRGDL